MSPSRDVPPPTGDANAIAGGELRPGDKVGRHVITGRLGGAGIGTTYVAYDRTLDRKIAIKFLPQIPGGDPDAAARLLAEASAMARLSHPHVLTVHDVGVVPGPPEVPYLALEYVEGQTLRRWREQGPRAVSEILSVMAAVAEG